MKIKKIRVRFAPSPTGSMHIGNLRTALYNRFFASKNKGIFYLRIEDTDQSRSVPGGLEAILKTLNDMGIKHDEGLFLENGVIVERGEYGPYVQSQRLSIYREQAEELVAKNKAYYCFCSPEELEEMRRAAAAGRRAPLYDRRCRDLTDNERRLRLESDRARVIRLRVPEEGTTAFTDLIRGEIVFQNNQLDDCVLLKSDGYPTYHLASVVDDHLMATSHVIRGEEWIPSTPKHFLLYQAFGWQPPIFAHLPLLLNSDRSKLSKRQGDVAVEEYLRRGYLPAALINFVALLGWNPSGDRELYSPDELAGSFELGKVNATGAVVNFEKLQWLNRHYLKQLSSEEYFNQATRHLLRSGSVAASQKAGEWVAPASGKKFDQKTLQAVIELERERIVALEELPEALAFIFQTPTPDPRVIPWKGGDATTTAERLKALREFLSGQSDWRQAELEARIKSWIKEQGWGIGDLLWPMRVALSGRSESPGPFEIAAVLGKAETLDRLQHATDSLKQ